MDVASTVGQSGKDDPGDVARDGVAALLAGKDQVVAGSTRNKLAAAAVTVLPGVGKGAGAA